MTQTVTTPDELLHRAMAELTAGAMLVEPDARRTRASVSTPSGSGYASGSESLCDLASSAPLPDLGGDP